MLRWRKLLTMWSTLQLQLLKLQLLPLFSIVVVSSSPFHFHSLALLGSIFTCKIFSHLLLLPRLSFFCCSTTTTIVFNNNNNNSGPNTLIHTCCCCCCCWSAFPISLTLSVVGFNWRAAISGSNNNIHHRFSGSSRNFTTTVKLPFLLLLLLLLFPSFYCGQPLIEHKSWASSQCVCFAVSVSVIFIFLFTPLLLFTVCCLMQADKTVAQQ